MKRILSLLILGFLCLNYSYNGIQAKSDPPEAPPGYTVFLLACGKYVVVPGDISGEEAAKFWYDLNKYYCGGK